MQSAFEVLTALDVMVLLMVKEVTSCTHNNWTNQLCLNSGSCTRYQLCYLHLNLPTWLMVLMHSQLIILRQLGQTPPLCPHYLMLSYSIRQQMIRICRCNKATLLSCFHLSKWLEMINIYAPHLCQGCFR